MELPLANQKWMTIQRNTFKNWVNVQLRDDDVHVEDLETDLADGKYLNITKINLYTKIYNK